MIEKPNRVIGFIWTTIFLLGGGYVQTENEGENNFWSILLYLLAAMSVMYMIIGGKNADAINKRDTIVGTLCSMIEQSIDDIEPERFMSGFISIHWKDGGLSWSIHQKDDDKNLTSISLSSFAESQLMTDLLKTAAISESDLRVFIIDLFALEFHKALLSVSLKYQNCTYDDPRLA